jgi:phloretin hydrolase
MNKKNRPELIDTEKQEPYANFYDRTSALVPSKVISDIKNSPHPGENALPFEKINDLLNPGYLSVENGYCHMPDGSVFVAVLTQMPNVTGDMLDWWFWWHPINALRYKVWYPDAHFGVSLDMDIDEYGKRKGPYAKRYWNTTNYPVEDIGTGKETLSIKFIPPADFGFDASRFEEANVATAICGIVGSVSKKLTQHTFMCHFVRKKDKGVEMRSRFWVGHTVLKSGVSETSLLNRIINTKAAKKLLLPRKVGLALAMHCTQEYNNLAGMLPELYNTYK